MVTVSLRRGIAGLTVLLLAGTSLVTIATVTATPAAAAHTGKKFTVSPYGTVIVSSLAAAPNVASAAGAASASKSASRGAGDPSFATQTANDLEQQTSTPPESDSSANLWNLRTTLARGNTQLVESTGRDLRVLDSSGAVLKSVDIHDFWKAASNIFTYTNDIVHDASADRYLMIGVRGVNTDDQLVLAVSNTDNALGTWTLYGLETETGKDRGIIHPRIGFGTDKIDVGYDDVDGAIDGCSPCHDGHLVVVQRSDVLSLGSVRGIDFNVNNGTAHPEFVTPAVPVPSQTKSVAFAAYMETNAGGHRAGVYRITGTPATNSTDYAELLTGFNNNPNNPSAAREPGGFHVLPGGWDDISLNRGGIAFESVAQQQALGGSGAILWLADNVNCNPGSGTRVCIKLVRVQVNAGATAITDTWENTIDSNLASDDFYEPSVVVAPVSDRVFVEYTHSSNTIAPRAEIETFIPTGTSTITTPRRVTFASGKAAYDDGSNPKFAAAWNDPTIVPEDLKVDTVWAAGLASTSNSGTWQSEVAQFTVDGPNITSLTPGGGAPGTQVTIDGSGFTKDAVVAFGAVPATNVTYNSSDELVASAPDQAAGTVDVTVTTPKGTSVTSAVTKYVYPAVVWTSLNGSNNVQAYNTITLGGPTVAVDPKPQGIAVTPDGRRVVVATSTGASIIDPETRTVIKKFAFAGADDVAVSPDSRWAYVTTPNALQVIDLTGPLPALDSPLAVPGSTKLHDIAVTSDGMHALVTDPTGNKLWNVPVTGVAISSKAFAGAQAIAVNGTTAWLTTKAATTGALIELNASTLGVLGNSAFDGDPLAVAASPAGDYVYVSLTAAGKLVQFHHTGPGSTALVGMPAVGNSPLGLVVLPNGTVGFAALNATTTPAQLEQFASPPPGVGTVNIKGKNPFDVAVATPMPLTCGASGVTPLIVTPGVTNWPAHDDFAILASIGSCADPASPINAQFREVFTPAHTCPAPPPGTVTTTLAVGNNMVPAQYVAVHCRGNWSVTVTVTNTANSMVIAKTTQGFVVN